MTAGTTFHKSKLTLTVGVLAADPGGPGLARKPHTVGSMAAHLVLSWIHRAVPNLKAWLLGV